jgi:hypothetical protein
MESSVDVSSLPGLACLPELAGYTYNHFALAPTVDRLWSVGILVGHPAGLTLM